MYESASQIRIRAVVLWGAVCALAWVALTVFFGGSAAHADEASPSGPLSSVTSLVTSAVTSATDPVLQVAVPVTQEVAPVVQKVVEPVVKAAAEPVARTAPAVVQAVAETTAAAPVAGATVQTSAPHVADAVETVVAPVTALLHQQPVSTVTDPVLGMVDQLPVIGDVGVTAVVRDIVGVVDGVVLGVADAADTVLPPVIDALVPRTPTGSSPVEHADPSTLARAGQVPGPITLSGADSARDRSLPMRAWFSSLDGAAASTGTAVSPTDPVGPVTLPDPLPAAAASSGASGTGSAGAPAALTDALDLLSAPSASGFNAGNDALPSCPASAFDVSPD